MHRLVYVSSATRRLRTPDLELLLAQSRRRNEQNGITGLLIYVDGNFMQALEGLRADVEATYRSIASDTRHHGVTCLFSDRAPEGRLFPTWSMAFKDMQRASLDGDIDVGRLLRDARTAPEPLETQVPSVAHRLLAGFAQSML